jgi:sulfide:quinone oxidoreductase
MRSFWLQELVIFSLGWAGAVVTNHSSRVFPGDEQKFTIVCQDKSQYYQPGFLFIPLGLEARRIALTLNKGSFSQKLN